MRISRIVIIIVAAAIIGGLALFAYSALVAPTSTGQWVVGFPYPLEVSDNAMVSMGVFAQSCVNGTATIYCIGGFDYASAPRNNVYSASVSSSRMSGWASDSAYPQTVGSQSCVSYDNYAYCVGGTYDDRGDDLASSYFARLTAAGPASWSQTTSYPVAIDRQACVASSGYIYCLGGNNETNGLNATAISTNSDWYAPISSTGIGAWQHTTTYPSSIALESCAASATDIFCVGGVDINGNGVNNVFYAPLSSSGIGQWISTTSYPIQAYHQACLIDFGNIICLGGIPTGTTSASNAVYSAPVSKSGVGSWHQAADYPMGVVTACTTAAGNLYCSGGYQNSNTVTWDTDYAPVQSLLA